MFFLYILLYFAAFIFMIIDIIDKLPVENGFGRLVGMTVLPHSVAIAWLLWSRSVPVPIIVLYCMAAAYFMFRLAVKPYRNKKKKGQKEQVSVRIRAMYGGKILLKWTAISLVFQTVFYIFAVRNNFWDIPQSIWIWDAVAAGLIVLGYGFNGIIRIMVLCRRLGVVKRVLAFFLLPIPVVGIFALVGLYKSAKAEYDYETTRAACDSQRVESQICATKYPLLMVHGMGFRDWKYFNYWGRIPKELIKNGAKIYYGHQEACATVENNSQLIKNKILEIIEETGCEKVNIIAHSKGGLDSRYAISKLGMEDYVASLTTVGTPHHGSEVTDLANKLPDSFYRKVSDFMDKRFRGFGDSNPDFYTLCHQFNTSYAEQFNKEVPDSDKVYYQSYASVMRFPFSFNLLGFTHMLLSRYGRNDGLITETSAQWGKFRGVFETKYIRGISHGDTIDLKREDYKGFDPREEYVKMVAELKELGY